MLIEKLKNQELVLENNRALLKPFTVLDIKPLQKLFYDEVLEHFELILDDKADKFEEYINYLIKISEYSHIISFVCFDKQQNQIVGVTQLKYIDFHNKKLEIGGTWYGKDFQRTGFNKACKQVLFDFCFEVLKMRRIQFSIDVDNIVSQKSMLKLGAKQEGLLRNNWVDASGKSRDDYYYSITIEDWDELKGTLFRGFYE